MDYISCSKQECEPPYGGKECCEFYKEGSCIAKGIMVAGEQLQRAATELAPSKNVVKLVARLKDEFGIEADGNCFYRLRPGYHMRNAGAYSWVICCKHKATGGSAFVGGHEPMRKYIVKRNRLEIVINSSGTEYTLYAFAPGEIGYIQEEIR